MPVLESLDLLDPGSALRLVNHCWPRRFVSAPRIRSLKCVFLDSFSLRQGEKAGYPRGKKGKNLGAVEVNDGKRKRTQLAQLSSPAVLNAFL